MIRRPDPAQWLLTVVTDAPLSRGRSHADIAREAIAGGADAIQLRDKEASGRALFEAACAIRRIAREAGVPFIVNDRVDVAIAADADGVHVGQEDLPAAAARAILGSGKILGVSAATVEEAIRAERDGADYIGFGPVFEARGTKPDAPAPLGLDLLPEIRARCKIPVIAIGGVGAGNAARVIEAGAHGVAVISAVVSAADVRAATASLREILGGARKEAR
jgi:thiamine-phosphate pyrophosphorylase